MSWQDILRERLLADEGTRNRVYPDTRGKMTLGVGHDVRDKPIRQEVIDLMLSNDMADAESDARAIVAVFDQLTDSRKAIVAEMAFQLGRTGLAGFPKMLNALDQGRWGDAADEMLDSEVARIEAPARWWRMADIMRTG